MSDEHVSATRVVPATAGAVFALLTDPRRHAGVDGTGWVGAAVDPAPLTRVGQVFRMRMVHADHPDGEYETANEVLVLEPDRAVAWRTGYHDPEVGGLVFGGWWWRYDLVPEGADGTRVTLTYDWSAVGPGPREYLDFPMFPTGHLEASLRHVAAMLEPHPR
ncbi:SRPBCC family protein [uncultured Nocardioides sp.]|uniref:SRPBCC family protein n=1 Tax=uncultured Nocardioides sp. TaxID=198441 RepID=UPI0026297898|nr:SRPBCC family protein [uncultured Nocardioides sp.]